MCDDVLQRVAHVAVSFVAHFAIAAGCQHAADRDVNVVVLSIVKNPSSAEKAATKRTAFSFLLEWLG